MVFNKCEMTGKLKEIYCENGLVTIKIYWDKNNTIFNAVKYKNENVVLIIKGDKKIMNPDKITNMLRDIVDIHNLVEDKDLTSEAYLNGYIDCLYENNIINDEEYEVAIRYCDTYMKE